MTYEQTLVVAKEAVLGQPPSDRSPEALAVRARIEEELAAAPAGVTIELPGEWPGDSVTRE